MFEYHPVSRAGFPHFPLCREWIKKSFHCRCRIFQYFPCKGLGTYPSALNTQLKAGSAIWRQTFLLKHEERVNFKATTRGQHWSSGAILPSNERMSVLHSGGNWKSIPFALKISLDHPNFPWASPSRNFSGRGKFGVRDRFPNSSLVLLDYGYSSLIDCIFWKVG